MLRLDQLLADTADGRSLERLLGSLQSVHKVGSSDWESVCPANPDHRGLCVRVTRIEEKAVVAWCSAGCEDQAVRAALAERLKKPESQKAAPTEEPASVLATTPLLGLTEAAQVLGCHRRTVRSYLRRGLLPGRFLAGRWKILREDLEAFIEAAPRARTLRAALIPPTVSAESLQKEAVFPRGKRAVLGAIPTTETALE